MWRGKPKNPSYFWLIEINFRIIAALSHGKDTKAIGLDDCFR
jgi:hypothetical protein